VPQGFVPAAGRAPGGNISISTKAGTGQFHGSLFYAGRPPTWGADDWFANRYDLRPSAPKLADRGGFAGGPLRRDRTFFSLSVERKDLPQIERVSGLVSRRRSPLRSSNGPAETYPNVVRS
jgi:hypothetical protein